MSDPVDCSPPGSFVHGIFQARILEWVAISFSRGSSRSTNQTRVSCIESRFLHCRQILYRLSRKGSPHCHYAYQISCHSEAVQETGTQQIPAFKNCPRSVPLTLPGGFKSKSSNEKSMDLLFSKGVNGSLLNTVVCSIS